MGFIMIATNFVCSLILCQKWQSANNTGLNSRLPWPRYNKYPKVKDQVCKISGYFFKVILLTPNLNDQCHKVWLKPFLARDTIK